MAKYKAYDDQKEREVKIANASIQPALNGTLLPAYGRDYDSEAAAIADFQKGLGFKHVKLGGYQMCSIRDCKEGDLVKIRFDRERQVTFYRVAGIDVK